MRDYGSKGTKLRIEDHEITFLLQQLIVAIASINSSKNSHVWEIFFLRVGANIDRFVANVALHCCNKDYPTS